ncbi:hypothetical protein 9F7_18 [uncultured Caudovirales phage]|uniref:Uncharacterized protein n=1 Tax=uncultured Caudovirales phage TaxID=2100421 RepID=A0A2H4J0P2_9CAUD|nr:hypothetical protein 8F6_10 [uncultured Caudovirales phage]ASN67937.1 hypothetical protein 3S4_16 [uncultured Caudovirales phage]ASN68403.1 hypothetical protein 3F6_62 [uncultured Caudovirales phage]ASN68455.1 hypothetical protein 9F7_18 [uncultured Caudovirales phage]ASN68544.1 hypothetical protein 8S7_11 [uncultured Caudovirales phage]
MQSADYVPGVSGWKMDQGLIELNGGPHGPVRIGNLEEPERNPSEEQLAAFCLTKQDLAEPFLVVDGITYINEASLRDATFDMKLQSRACDDSGRPLWEMDGATGGVTVRSGDAETARPKLKVTITSCGKWVAEGLGIGISQDQRHTDESFMRRVQAAAQMGAQRGYRMILNDLKRSR